VTGDGTIEDVVRRRSIVICCGSGGVGKTTTAAACALEAARAGRIACVVTIDPARRLANALGLDALTNRPTLIEGPWPGELHALMLDPKRTFDDLVQRYSDSAEQAEDIQVNRMYQNLTGTLSGTQEYMAMEKLYELVEEGGFDVVVVDTPPSRNALDFLDAPRRLTHFLENRLFQALMKPTRAGLRFMGVAAQALLRTISRVAGADIVADAVSFFQAFEGMEEGFRDRAARVRELLVQSDTAFVLVASPRPDSVDEAVHFAEKLAESEMSVTALIVNRVQPRFADDDQLAALPAPVNGSGGAYGALVDNLQGYTAASDREEQAYAELVSKVAPAPVYRVPLLNTDVHDLDGLGTIADLLFGADTTGGGGEVGTDRPADGSPVPAPVSGPAQER
jgi:anion-transporting  ArsA/GET3 family ATPase